MSNRKGRPSICDEAALRRVADHIIDMEEKGSRCSIRAAILQTSGERITGNSADAMLWRLQRKWRDQGQTILVEARERRTRARRYRPATILPKIDGGISGLAELARTAFDGLAPYETAARLASQIVAIDRHLEAQRALARAFQLNDGVAHVLQTQDEVERALRFHDEIARMSRLASQIEDIASGCWGPTRKLTE